MVGRVMKHILVVLALFFSSALLAQTAPDPAPAASEPVAVAATSEDVATLTLALCVVAVMFSGFIGFRIGYSQ